MISVQNITSEIFNSNVYLITSSEHKEVFLIDCGGFDPIIDCLLENAVVSGIFLTHYHYDHIYFVKNWIERYPKVKFYGSQITFEGLSNSKRNLSFYHGDPISVSDLNYQILICEEKVELFNNISISTIETEGHCEGSLSFLLDKFAFTGDALIPNIPIVTKLRTGNKDKARASVRKIKSILKDDFIVCPGHFEMYKYQDVDWQMYLSVSSK